MESKMMMKICVVSMCFLSVLVTVSITTTFLLPYIIFSAIHEKSFAINFRENRNESNYFLYNLKKKNRFWRFILHLQAEVNPKAATSIYDFTVKDTYGQDVSLDKFKGNVVIVVNIASNCGLAKSQYAKMMELRTKYHSKGKLFERKGHELRN